MMRGYSAADAVVFLVPILVCSFIAGLWVFFPIYLQLVKYNKGGIFFVAPAAVVVTNIIILIIIRRFSDPIFYIASTIAAVSGTCCFFMLLKIEHLLSKRHKSK